MVEEVVLTRVTVGFIDCQVPLSMSHTGLNIALSSVSHVQDYFI
jgi:hypothetical protein